MIRRGWSCHADGLLACLSGGSAQANRHPCLQFQSWRVVRNRHVSTDDGPGNGDGLPGSSLAGPTGASESDSAFEGGGSRDLEMSAREGRLRKRKRRMMSTTTTTTTTASRGGDMVQDIARLRLALQKEARVAQRSHDRHKHDTQEMSDDEPLSERGSIEAENVKDDDTTSISEAQGFWPLLKRKQGPNLGKYRFSSPTRRQPVERPAHSSNASRLMLVVDGLSPNLNASDFYRLGPSGLSEWGAVIKKVQQKRDPITFEPHGQYYVTFDSSEAAVAYRDKLIRLHKLSALKLESATGLWESTVPLNLKARLVSAAELHDEPDAAAPSEMSSTASSGDDLNQLVEAFTIAPASLSPIHFQRKRVDIAHPWGTKLAEIVQPLGFGEKPTVIILDVYPPTMNAKELLGFILMDGYNRGLRWQTTTPYHLKPLRSAADDDEKGQGSESADDDQDSESMRASFQYKDHYTTEKLRGRFILVSANESEAHRFQRNWNNRRLTTSNLRTGRYIVHASIIKW